MSVFDHGHPVTLLQKRASRSPSEQSKVTFKREQATGGILPARLVTDSAFSSGRVSHAAAVGPPGCGGVLGIADYFALVAHSSSDSSCRTGHRPWRPARLSNPEQAIMSYKGRVPGRPRPPTAPAAAAIIATASLALLAAACGGSPGSHVAQLGSTTTHSSPSSADRGGSSQAGAPAKYEEALAYAQCMRSHGVPDFPDPTGNGMFKRVKLKAGQSQSQLQAAENDCRHLLPNGGQPSQAQQERQLGDELKFAQCMRSHGVPDWPDPSKMGWEYEFNLRAVGISFPLPPQAVAAEKECQAQLSLSKSQLHLPGSALPGGSSVG